MIKIIALLAIVVAAYSAEIPSSYDLIKKHAETELKSDVETHAILKKDNKSEQQRPVYVAEEHRNDGRANIKPVRPLGPVIKYDNMLADQPAMTPSTEINRVDQQPIANYGYVPNPVEVAYPDVQYAPGYDYGLGNNYASSPNNYDMYGNALGNYLVEPDTSALGFLWSQLPDSRTIVNFMGRTFVWVLNSMFIVLFGSFLTVGFCSYTNLCSITFHGVGPIREEMRALVTPERLEKISTAADFVKTAIDKYQKIQKAEPDTRRSRRGIFY